MFPFLLPLMGGISGLLGGGAAATGMGAAAATGASAMTGAAAGAGIGGLMGSLGGWGLPLGLMGLTAMDRLMTPGMEDEEEEKRKKYKFTQNYDPTTNSFSGGYTDLGMVSGPMGGNIPMYRDGGLVNEEPHYRIISEGDKGLLGGAAYYGGGLKDYSRPERSFLEMMFGNGGGTDIRDRYKPRTPVPAEGKGDRESRKYADGGMVDDGFDPMQAGIASLQQGGGQSATRQLDKQIVQQAIMALTGQIPQEQPISMFIQRFGKPALADLAQRVVEMEGKGMQDGMMVSGPGDGMSDEIPAQAGQMPARLSDGEYVVPADIVSSLGNGSSDAGASELQNMVRRIRREKNGSSQQPAAIEPSRYMPV